MPVTTACIAGEEIHRQWDDGRIVGEPLGPKNTPFGPSGDIFLVQAEESPVYLLPRHGRGMAKTSPRRVNDRANLYALRDLGVQFVLAWAPGGAITHNIAVGDLVILHDLIDRTFLREDTYFEDSPLGYLRQFPVFCPTLRRAAGEVLHGMKLVYHGSGTAAVCEGPRLETPAEVRALGTVGAEVVTHSFAPEAFLARELQICYAAVCYVVNYAETGSKHSPFAGQLFGNISQRSDRERLNSALAGMEQFVRQMAEAVAAAPRECECDQTMARNKGAYNLSEDWHQWFK